MRNYSWKSIVQAHDDERQQIETVYKFSNNKQFKSTDQNIGAGAGESEIPSNALMVGGEYITIGGEYVTVTE